MIRMLDTNAYSALMRGDEKTVELVRSANEIRFSAVVAGELLWGFRHGSRHAANRRRLESFLAEHSVEFVPVGWETADRYSRLFFQLRRKGRPIPSNDVWIAAQALECAAELVSLDTHFDAIDGLAWVNPAEA